MKSERELGIQTHERGQEEQPHLPCTHWFQVPGSRASRSGQLTGETHGTTAARGSKNCILTLHWAGKKHQSCERGEMFPGALAGSSSPAASRFPRSGEESLWEKPLCLPCSSPALPAPRGGALLNRLFHKHPPEEGKASRVNETGSPELQKMLAQHERSRIFKAYLRRAARLDGQRGSCSATKKMLLARQQQFM